MMQILANENIPGPLVAGLRDLGHDVVWVRDVAPGASDPEIVSRAQRAGRVILTLDKDYGHLVFGLRESPPGVVLVRFGSVTIAEVSKAVLAAIASREDWPGHFSVIERGRVRMISLPESR